MFKQNRLPQKKPFSVTAKQITEDVEAICSNKEEENKLFHCLDENPPQENKFSQMEEFLKGTNNLEVVHKTLEGLIEEVDTLSKDISESIKNIKTQIAAVKIREV